MNKKLGFVLKSVENIERTTYIFIRLQNECILEPAKLSVRPCVHVPNTTLCQSAGGGIKSHSVTALGCSG